MTNAELIEVLRYCGADKGCLGCPLDGIALTDCILQVMIDAADALETAEKRIAELERILKAVQENSGINFRLWQEAEAQLPKEGEWIRKEVKVCCPRDCWNPSACAIDGTWNEAEGWNLEMQDGFCSVCGEQDEKYYKHHYCPNCGSRMQTVTDCHTLNEKEKGEQE